MGRWRRSRRRGPEGSGFRAVVFMVTMAVATSVRERLDRLFQQRIALFDGSMGVMLQHKGLSDAEFRCERFRNHPRPLRNTSGVLGLTQPELVPQVHGRHVA